MHHPRTSSVATVSNTTDNTTTVPSINSMVNQTDNSPNNTTSASDNTQNSSNINIPGSSVSNKNNNTSRNGINPSSNSNLYKSFDNNNSNTNILIPNTFNPIELQTNNSTDMNVDLNNNAVVAPVNSNEQRNISPSTSFPLESKSIRNSDNMIHIDDDKDSQSSLFKHYDPATGEFLRKGEDNSIQSDLIKDNTNNNNNNFISRDIQHQDKSMLTTSVLSSSIHHESTVTKLPLTTDKIILTDMPPALKIFTTMKARSYSVPTILHSSLKKLSTNNATYIHPRNGNPHRTIKNNKVTKSIYGSSSHTSNNTNHDIVNPENWRHHHQHQHHIFACQHNQHSSLYNNRNLASNIAVPPIPNSRSTSTISSSVNSSASSSSSSTTTLLSQKTDIQKTVNIGISPVVSVQNTRVFDNKDHVLPNQIRTNNNESLVLKDRIDYFIKQQHLQLNTILPPINLQCLKEIDLQEIVKNPQLRHDIVFDPLLQFRPNLDGERGVKKRQIWEAYWNDVENELIVYMNQPSMFNYNCTRLVPLFNTLRDILLTIVPQREYQQILNILDTELNVQNLVKSGNVWSVMNDLASWLAQLFKHHCAPMRDAWVDKMQSKFENAMQTQSMTELIEGFKSIFQILEAMKLDIANHQIRLLRPALLSNAVEFERQYFNSLMEGIYLIDFNTNDSSINDGRKFLLKSSLMWFKEKFNEYSPALQNNKTNTLLTIPQVYRICIKSVISLLSCRKMVKEYPTSLSFDHTRLILLRADIRQLICLLVCRLLFQQLVANDKDIGSPVKKYILTNYDNNKLQNEIVSIIVDEHGNCRWTKNTLSIAVHLCKVIKDLTLEYNTRDKDKTENPVTKDGINKNENITVSEPQMSRSNKLPQLDNEKISFAKSWLSKQTQPLSEIYSVLEKRVFSLLEESIFNNAECSMDGRVNQEFVYLYNPVNTNGSSNNKGSMSQEKTHNKNVSSYGRDTNKVTSFRPLTKNFKTNTNNNIMAITEMEQFENIYRHLNTIINFHWSVFSSHYIDMLADNIQTI